MDIAIKYLNQVGIILEIFGAAYMVYEAYKSRKLLSVIDPTTFGGVGEMAEKTHQIISSQVKNEIIGFGLLATGLLLQLIGRLNINA